MPMRISTVSQESCGVQSPKQVAFGQAVNGKGKGYMDISSVHVN